MLKGLRIFILILLSVSVASCVETTSHMTKAERRKVEAQNRAIGTALAAAVIVGVAVAAGASGPNRGYYRAAPSRNYYTPAPRYGGGYYGRGYNRNYGPHRTCYDSPYPSDPNC